MHQYDSSSMSATVWLALSTAGTGLDSGKSRAIFYPSHRYVESKAPKWFYKHKVRYNIVMQFLHMENEKKGGKKDIAASPDKLFL